MVLVSLELLLVIVFKTFQFLFPNLIAPFARGLFPLMVFDGPLPNLYSIQTVRFQVPTLKGWFNTLHSYSQILDHAMSPNIVVSR